MRPHGLALFPEQTEEIGKKAFSVSGFGTRSMPPAGQGGRASRSPLACPQLGPNSSNGTQWIGQLGPRLAIAQFPGPVLLEYCRPFLRMRRAPFAGPDVDAIADFSGGRYLA